MTPLKGSCDTPRVLQHPAGESSHWALGQTRERPPPPIVETATLQGKKCNVPRAEGKGKGSLASFQWALTLASPRLGSRRLHPNFFGQEGNRHCGPSPQGPPGAWGQCFPQALHEASTIPEASLPMGLHSRWGKPHSAQPLLLPLLQCTGQVVQPKLILCASANPTLPAPQVAVICSAWMYGSQAWAARGVGTPVHSWRQGQAVPCAAHGCLPADRTEQAPGSISPLASLKYTSAWHRWAHSAPTAPCRRQIQALSAWGQWLDHRNLYCFCLRPASMCLKALLKDRKLFHLRVLRP